MPSLGYEKTNHLSNHGGAGLRLTGQARTAIEKASRLMDRDAALLNLRDLLDPDRKLSTWALAGDIASHLHRFRRCAYGRATAGYRGPKNVLEVALYCLSAAGCPTSQRRLFDLLAELGL